MGPEFGLFSSKISLHHEQVTRLLNDGRITLPPQLTKATEARKIEYIVGRLCALKAIENLSHQASPLHFLQFLLKALHLIGSQSQGCPNWPKGIVGSITHDGDLVTAIVARETDVLGIGIDMTSLNYRKLWSKVKPKIITGDDLASNGQVDLSQVAIVFSAKESIFKCFYPLTKRIFGFEDAAISAIDDSRGTFFYCLKCTLDQRFQYGYQGEGSFRVEKGKIYTKVFLPQPMPS